MVSLFGAIGGAVLKAGKSVVGGGSLLAGIKTLAISTGLSLGTRALLQNLLYDRATSRYEFDQPQPEVSGIRCIPIIVGRVRASGNVIAIDERGRDRFANMVFGVSEGPISDVYDIRALNTPPRSKSDDFLVRGPVVFLGGQENGFRRFGADARSHLENTSFHLQPDQDYPFTALVWGHFRATPESAAGVVPPLTWTVDGLRCQRIYNDPEDAGTYGRIRIGEINRFLDFYDADLGADGYLAASILTGSYHLTTLPTTPGGIAHAMTESLNGVTSGSNDWVVTYSTPTASARTRLRIQRSATGHSDFRLLTHTGDHQPGSVWNDAGWTEHSRQLVLHKDGQYSQDFVGPDVSAEYTDDDGGLYTHTADHPFLSTFSRNPARILYTLLTDRRIGAAIPENSIDRESFDHAEERADESVNDDDAAVVRLGNNVALPSRAVVMTNAGLFRNGGYMRTLESGRREMSRIPAVGSGDLFDTAEGGEYLNLDVPNAYVAVILRDEHNHIHASGIGAVELAPSDYTRVGKLEYSTAPDPDPEDDNDWVELDVQGDVRGRMEFLPIPDVSGFRLTSISSTEQFLVTDTNSGLGDTAVYVGKMNSFKAILGNAFRPARYQVDLIIDRARPFGRHLDDILATFRAALVEQDGSISLRLFEDGPVLQEFTEDDILPSSFAFEYPSIRETPNRFTVIFRDSENLHYPAGVTVDDEARQREERRVRAGVIRLDGITRRVQAELIATFTERAAHYQLHSCRFTVPAQGFRRCPMDIIAVAYAPAGYVRRLFRVLSVRPDENQQVTLECIEHLPGLERDLFLKRPRSSGSQDVEPSPYVAEPEELLFDDSVKAAWAKRVVSWAGGGGPTWYRPDLGTLANAITLSTEAAEGDVLLIQSGNTVLRPRTDTSDPTGEWSVLGNRLHLHGFNVGPNDDLRIGYVPRV